MAPPWLTIPATRPTPTAHNNFQSPKLIQFTFLGESSLEYPKVHHGGSAFPRASPEEVFGGGDPVNLNGPRLNLLQYLKVTMVRLANISLAPIGMINPVVGFNSFPTKLVQDSHCALRGSNNLGLIKKLPNLTIFVGIGFSCFNIHLRANPLTCDLN